MVWEQWDKIVVSGDKINELVDVYKTEDGRNREFTMVIYKGFIQVIDQEFNHYLVFNVDRETLSGTFRCWIDYKGKKYKYFDGYISRDRDYPIHGEYIPGIIEVPDVKDGQTEVESLIGSLHVGLSIVMIHMEHGVEVIERSVETFGSSISTKKKSKKKKRKPRVLQRVVYDIKLTKESMKRVMERHTESWTVRGHWRQLSDGRQTWVRSHVKGDQTKLEPSTYDLESV